MCYFRVVTFPRITVRQDQLGGVPCIRGLRIPVSVVIDMVADGMSEQEILDLFPDLERDDLEAVIQFASGG
ncbi:MAG: hypothetical protein B6A08_10400 [Sorangiineae bacterium NIC37A_2]|nr:MAG: hypothetical protein B6A08_10400 [Sorangiineae bacterium NIC37A_2]